MLRFSIGWPVFRLIAILYHYSYSGYESVPRKEPLLVVSNHITRKDPVAINLALKRPVHYMAKKEAFQLKNSIFEAIMVRTFFAYPVDRERPGPESIRRTVSFLENNECVGIFPEGTRFDDKKLHPFTNGAAYFAWKTGVQVLPIGVTEAKGKDYHVNIGKPFRVPDLKGRPHKVLPEITLMLRGKILELLPPEWESMESEEYEGLDQREMTAGS